MSLQRPPDAFEVELPGPWPPCPECGAQTRVAVAASGADHVGFACGAMHELAWTGDGKRYRTIPPGRFREGGAFAGLIPEEYLRPGARRGDDRRSEIDERRRARIREEQAACAGCGVAPVRNARDRGTLLYWLKDHRPDLFGAVMAVVNAAVMRPTLTTWFDALLAERADLVLAIRHAVRDASLQPVQSIAPPVAGELWEQWSAAERKIATGTLAFGYCGACAETVRETLPSRDELLRRHVRFNHDGSEASARAHRDAWSALERVLDTLDAYRAKQPLRAVSEPGRSA